MTKILALDQASKVSGWAIFIDGKLKDWGHFTTEQDDIAERLVLLRKFIIDKIQEWDIDIVAFEDIQMQSSNVKTYKALANVFGVVLETIKELEKEYIIVHSQIWKSKLQIKGRTRVDQKKDAQRFVTEKYSIKATQDESDAICIGTCVLMGGKLNDNVELGHDWSK